MKGLTREVLISTGLRLIDEVGLEGLSVRRLAAELGVQSPALYWHVKTKQELLDGMANEIILRAGMGPPERGEKWQDWLRRRSRAYRRSLLATRDGARIVSSAVRSGDSAQHFETELAAMVDLGFSPLLAVRTISALGDYITGHVLQEQQNAQIEPALRVAAEERAAMLAGMPTLAAALSAGNSHGAEAFEHGLDVIISGTATALPEHRAPSPR